MVTNTTPTEQRVLLQHISWQTFKTRLAEMGLSRGSRLAYDSTSNPPPDLVLEVEYSRPKINKLQLYASMGVPEFWRYDGRLLRIYMFEAGQYLERSDRPTFAPVPVSEIPRFIAESRKVGEIAITRAFRAWVRQHK